MCQLVTLQPGPRRWPVAVRAAICVAVPCAVGLAVGELPLGLLATIGAFTALYGSDRPYLNRGLHLAVIAVCFAGFVALGDWAAVVPVLGVLAIALVTVLAVLVCNALVVGPPGAYMFVLACAAGTGVAEEHLSPWRTGLLVLAGGAFAWLVQMAGALVGVRRPERRAVAAASDATARYAEALGTPGETHARHTAAESLHRAWQILVNFQPVRSRRESELPALREANLRLHVLFAQLMAAGGGQHPPPPDAGEAARRMAAAGGAGVGAGEIPLGRPGTAVLLRRAVAPGSIPLEVAGRTGIAALLAGLVASTLGVDHAYWAAAAAVLVLHQDFDRWRTLQRTVERVAGTGIGLVLAGLVFGLHPQGVWLVALLAALQFTVEMLVVRNYALAVVFITPLALTISSGGRPVDDLPRLLGARGIDTVIGCAMAVIVYLLLARQRSAARLGEAVAVALERAATVSTHIAETAAGTDIARADRRDLQVSLLAMVAAYDMGAAGSRSERAYAERMWPVVVATQDVAYRILATCWAIEQGEIAEGAMVFGSVGAAPLRSALFATAFAVRSGTLPAPFSGLPEFGSAELSRLRESLVCD